MRSLISGSIIIALAGSLTACDRIDSLLMEPAITAEQWCEAMPCVDLFSSGVILNQPLSTLLVYALGLLWLWAALRFWKTRAGSDSRWWWSASMLLGGIAALSAGTSYQAFGYELKCAGREVCTWTSWWEIAYLILQGGSMNAMVIAVAYSCAQGFWRRALIMYALVNFALHLLVTIAGSLIPNRLMISFELLVLFSTPTFIGLFIFNSARYFRLRSAVDLALLWTWIIMSLANLFYFAYLSLGFTQVLWERGVWFSENDVLHVLVMVWVYYVGWRLLPRVSDHPASIQVPSSTN